MGLLMRDIFCIGAVLGDILLNTKEVFAALLFIEYRPNDHFIPEPTAIFTIIFKRHLNFLLLLNGHAYLIQCVRICFWPL